MIRVGLIGLGEMGKNHYRVMTTALRADCQLVAVIDPINRAAQNPHNIPQFAGLEDLLKQGVKLDAAIIAVPTAKHFELASQLLEMGIPTLIEKPVAATVEQAESLSQLAKKTGVRVAVGHTERFNPVVLALKRELKNKDIFSVSITRVGPIPPRIQDVGILTDLAVHDIDLVRELTGREIQKASMYSSRKLHSGHEDNAVLSFQLSDDIVASVTTNWLTPFKKRMVEVATKEAYFEADLLGQALTAYSSYVHDSNSYLVQKVNFPKGESLAAELKAFFDYVRTGVNAGLATIDDSKRTLELIRPGVGLYSR